ncbi:MAG TPA: glycosyltransferase, partial [Anaerolineae bacterium]|nr:glycosyltransferase [Anaerolineae bacterium]
MTHTIVYFSDSAGFGGAEDSLLNLLSGLDRCRWQPVLIHHPEPGIRPLLEEARKLDVTTVSVPAMPEGRQGAAHVPHFVRLLRRIRPTVFHANLTWPLSCKYALFAAALARVPAIVAAQQLFVEIRYTRLIRLKQRAFAAGIHRHIAVSHATASQLSQTFAIPAHKMRVVHPGIPLARFSRAADPAMRTSLNGGTGRPIVLSIARLDKQKGQVYLLQAAARVPEAVFVLVGDGPDRGMLEAQTLELGVSDRVILMGYRRDVPELLAACDVFVMSSLWDGLSLTLLEALAAGKPVIATDVGGAHEAVEHGET